MSHVLLTLSEDSQLEPVYPRQSSPGQAYEPSKSGDSNLVQFVHFLLLQKVRFLSREMSAYVLMTRLHRCGIE